MNKLNFLFLHPESSSLPQKAVNPHTKDIKTRMLGISMELENLTRNLTEYNASIKNKIQDITYNLAANEKEHSSYQKDMATLNQEINYHETIFISADRKLTSLKNKITELSKTFFFPSETVNAFFSKIKAFWNRNKIAYLQNAVNHTEDTKNLFSKITLKAKEKLQQTFEQLAQCEQNITSGKATLDQLQYKLQREEAITDSRIKMHLKEFESLKNKLEPHELPPILNNLTPKSPPLNPGSNINICAEVEAEEEEIASNGDDSNDDEYFDVDEEEIPKTSHREQILSSNIDSQNKQKRISSNER